MPLMVLFPVAYGKRVGMYGDIFDFNIIERSIRLPDSFLLKLLEGLKAVNELAEDGEFPIKAGLLGIEDEELRAILVRAGIRHAEDPTPVMLEVLSDLICEEFILCWVDGLPTLACAGGVSTLNNEAADVAVEFGPAVVILG